MAASIETLEKTVTSVEVDATEEPVEMSKDLEKALELLRQCSVILDYVSDPMLCRTLSKRERDALERCSATVTDFIIDTRAAYEE
jgi:hypothetical protein